jgi:hypothetical protein
MFTRLHASQGRLARAAWIAFATVCAPVIAPAEEAAPATADATGLETVVVTGSAISGGVTKLEASYNIVTANEEQIRQSNPKSTADLLKISPGLWPESTGGQTGANIEIAGFPGGGDAPYFTTQLMGSPLYGMPTLSFFETTSIFRLDDTVRTVEILTPSYTMPLGFGEVVAYVSYTHVGDHTQDQSGLQQLGSYYTWDFGVTANVGENWQFAIRGTNVTDELGLTESNSRIFGVAAGAGGVLLARPIEGSEINVQAKYLW